MTQIKKEDVSQEVFDLYDDYAHNRLSRLSFMKKLSLYAVGGLTVPAIMSFLMPDYKGNVQINADDPRLKSEYITYSSPKGGGTIKEKLLAFDDKGRMFKYAIVESVLPLSHYTSTLVVKSTGKGKSSVTWSGTFKRKNTGENPADTENDKTALDTANSVYAGGLDNLKKMLETK